LKETADWAEATFATLEQYSAMQAEISAIKTLIDKTKAEITEEYTAAIEAAISNSETSMKAWVNTLLAQGYYTISDINGKVSALEALIADGDNNLQKQINEHKTALQQAKADLTNEYKQYINQAIASGGIIDQAIATQVRKAQDELQSKIDAINERLDALEDRLGKLEEDFVNRIQSLKYIPEFSDGKAKMSDFYKTISLDFLVSPSNQAKAVQNAWETNQDVVTAFLRCTKNPETKAISPAVQLLVTSVVGNADGTLNVTLREDSANPIDTDFFTGDSDAVVYIQISDGNSDIFSDMVEIKSCIELSVYEDLSPLVNGVYKTANCYIVTRAGSYKFKAYKGNSQELAGSSESAVHPIGVINHAKVLWESFGTEEVPTKGDLINVADYEDGYVVFETPDQYREGNAVIAVRDESGNVLWSWHIWLTDQPEEQVYYNNAGTMMDRNLGATSATPGDIGAFGLLYQYGRKDPFLGSCALSGTTLAASTGIWGSASVEYDDNKMDFAGENPMTFALGWTFGRIFADGWHTSESEKGLYDPCPVGYRVPDGGENGFWAASYVKCVGDSTNLGMYWTLADGETTAWYPAAGYRFEGSGALEFDGGKGFYWSVSLSNDTPSYCLHFNYNLYYSNGDADPAYSARSGYGYSVRCVKEE
jgi:archaellum component FlaC